MRALPTFPAKPLPRWLLVIALWLALTIVFSSQLYFAGYVRPWPRAFASEGAYWLSWGILAPAVFWMCSATSRRGWAVYAPALLAGFIVCALMSPFIANAARAAQQMVGLCLGECEALQKPFTREFLSHILFVAGINLPVYAGFVLAWHAATYYRESRDRQIAAAQLEARLHQAQLQALRSQLNPHFLFNALHSIAELVHRDAALAERLLVRLGELLRQVLNSSAQPEVPLEDELAFIRGYLDIEKMRLGDRLTLEWDVEPAALRARVPSLILQPLVENAIQHGVAPHSVPGHVTVRARVRDGALLLEVRDTGPGMPADASGRGGIGLANTRARLERLYGDAARLEWECDGDCVVRVRLPA